MKDKKTFVVFLIVLGIAQTSSIFAPRNSQPQSSWPKYALASATATTLGFIGYKYLQHAKRNKDYRLNIAGQSVGRDVKKKITDYVMPPELEKLAYEDREKLLQAIIPFPSGLIKDSLRDAQRWISNAFTDYQRCPSQFRTAFEQLGHRPIFGCRIIPSYGNLTHQRYSLLDEQQKNPELIYIKNKTHPRVLLKGPLGANEFAVIGFSDGDIQIILNDSDRRILNNLSYEQREFIASIYNHNHELRMTKEQTRIFDSLPAGIQERLKKNYSIHRYSIHDTLPKISFKWPSIDFLSNFLDVLDDFFQKSKPYLGLAAAAGSIVRMGQVKSGDEKLARGLWLGTTSMLWFFVACAEADQQTNFSWIIPCAGLGLFEGALGCYSLGEYLAKKN